MKYTTENLKEWDGIQITEGVSIEAKFALLNDDGTVYKTYYQFRDAMKTFAVRGMMALQVYEEWQNRMTNERLKVLFAAIKDECNQNPVKLGNIIDLVTKGQERIEWVMPTTELIQRMACVSYFDNTESPYEYDASYQIQKLALWRKYEVSDFFIGCSLSDLVPFPSISEADFESYQRVLTQLEEILNIRLEEASPKI
jgi:hypothetical protein